MFKALAAPSAAAVARQLLKNLLKDLVLKIKVFFNWALGRNQLLQNAIAIENIEAQWGQGWENKDRNRLKRFNMFSESVENFPRTTNTAGVEE